MTEYSPIPVRVPLSDYDADDQGMPSMEERLLRSAANMAMLDALPPLPEPPQDTTAADEAVRGLIDGLLSDSELRFLGKGNARFNRDCKRSGNL